MYPVDLTKTIPPAIADKKVFLSDADLDKIALFLVGNQQRFRENIIIPRMLGPVQIKTIEEKRIDSVMESCAFKSIMSCVLGMLFHHSFLMNKYQNIITNYKYVILCIFICQIRVPRQACIAAFNKPNCNHLINIK